VRFAREHLAPDAGGRGDFGQRPAKGLDRQEAVITDLLERGEDLEPRDVAFAGRAAVVFGDVEVDEAIARGPDGAGGVFLFDVGVEGIDPHDVKKRSGCSSAIVQPGGGRADCAAVDEARAGRGIGSRVVRHPCGG